MPITVLYCADCTPPKVLAGGDCAGATHEHPDGTTHEELVPEQLPHITTDGTTVTTYEEWLTHLEGYLP